MVHHLIGHTAGTTIRSVGWGELAALRRKHIDTTAGLVRVEAAVVELTNGALVTGPPRSASGVRWVSIPPFLLPDVIEHLRPDLRGGVSASDRERPLVTEIDGPLMARRSWVLPAHT